MVTLVMFLQCENAEDLIFSTELGMVMLFRLSNSSKAIHSIVFTELGITVFEQPDIKVFELLRIIALQFPRES